MHYDFYICNENYVSDETLLQIWRKWREAVGVKEVRRAGLIATRAYGDEEPDGRQRESDGDHIAGFMQLLCLLRAYLPELMVTWQWQLVFMAGPFHEQDELADGDTLDDGTQDASRKASGMQEVLQKFFADVPDSKYLVEVLVRAEKMKVPFAEVFDSDKLLDMPAWVLKAVDKLESLLWSAWMHYAYGRTGDIARKRNPSELDLAIMRELGTGDISFCWAWHYRYLMGTVFWRMICLVLHDVYPESEIPPQFCIPGV